MTHDFYCDEVLSGRTAVEKVTETETVLGFNHTRPSYPVHIVVIPKQHIESLITLLPTDNDLILELLVIIKKNCCPGCHRIWGMSGFDQSGRLSGLKTSTFSCHIWRYAETD
jgi:hypothetical protein